jgi:hypothetical protein
MHSVTSPLTFIFKTVRLAEELYQTQPQRTPSHTTALDENTASLILFTQEINFVINHKIKNINKTLYVSDPHENVNKSHNVQRLKPNIRHSNRMILAPILHKIYTTTNSSDTITQSLI